MSPISESNFATEPARVAQPIYFLVFGFKDTLQNAGHEAKDFCFVVCDVNSEKEWLQVNFSIWEQIFSYKLLKISRIGFMPKSKNGEKQ